ncbi:MarR family winged helix-turn-helix transcriptional regulator [Macrococcus sp. DPC7161]|uniref:MarR family winged helix-turn-helix transcriptional regulator n=1 Tax=Macrococcus sp. DPC7161 TaxID=2507060 RepID=UPI00100A9C07|nr:MarR family transcriptional regulator [Macrococcus sp. DPC7161]RXK17979.1 MarR family transcriptional regulator [Macrococcus sp. DPC7161]
MTKEKTVDFQLYLLQREMIKKYNQEFLKDYDISYQHYLVLMVLFEFGTLPVLTLGEKLAFQSGTITPILKKMEQHDLVIRERKPEDERVVQVRLSKKGEKIINELCGVPEIVYHCSKLSTEDYNRLMYLANKITTNMTY